MILGSLSPLAASTLPATQIPTPVATAARPATTQSVGAKSQRRKTTGTLATVPGATGA